MTVSGVSNPGTLIIQFIQRSRDESIIYDKATIRNLLELSEFQNKYSSHFHYLHNKHELVIDIKNNQDIEHLINIKELKNEQGIWPIACRKPINQNKSSMGVLKGIHPTISQERILAETTRNNFYNKKQGIDIIEVERIYNWQNDKLHPTWNVKIHFKGETRPENILYDNEIRVIHP